MKDTNGFYYYPFPENKRVRMYVKKEMDTFFFRLWSADDKQLWTEHGWVPYEAIQKAADLYNTEIYDQKSRFNPNKAYDLTLAKALLKSEDEA